MKHYNGKNWCTVYTEACAHKMLHIEDRGLYAALRAAGQDPFAWLIDPKDYTPVLLFEDEPKIRQVIRKYNSRKLATDTPEYSAALANFDDAVEYFLSEIAKTIRLYVDDDGNLKRRPYILHVAPRPKPDYVD